MPAISLGSSYAQNFDSLPNSGSATWTNDSTLAGWYSNRTPLAIGTGSSNTGSLYSFGAASSSERALGAVGSGSTGTVFYGLQLVNDTAIAINSLDISYIGEQWRNGGGTGLAQTVDFQYQVGATSITAGTWTDFNALDFTSPVFNTTAGALDGNAAANRVSLSATLSGLNLAPNQEIWLRWSDIDHPSNDHGLAIDNLTVSAIAAGPVEPVINEFSFNHVGTDTREYIEVFGSANTSYSTYSLLALEGDFSGTATGTIDRVYNLGSTDGNGLWQTGFLPTDTLENGTQTLLLVKNFTGVTGADLDANDDGILDATPWESLVDSVAVNDGGASDRTYSPVVLTPNYDGQPFAPGGASRIPNGTDTNSTTDWVRNDFDLAGIAGFTGTPVTGEALNTPGATNQLAGIATPGFTLTETAGNTSVNEATPTIADSYNIKLNTVPTGSVAVAIAADGQTEISVDGVNFAQTVTLTLNGTTEGTVSVRAINDTAVEAATHTSTLTHTVATTDPNYASLTIPNLSVTVLDNDTVLSFTKIHDIQGSGSTFNPAFSGIRAIEGIVVGKFPGAAGLSGFYVQEEDADADANLQTSEGIFVFDPSGLFSGNVGDKVQVSGEVNEFVGSGSSLTQLRNLNFVTLINPGNVLPTATVVNFPIASVTNLEAVEGMRVIIPQTLTVTEHFQLGRFGQVLLSSDGATNQPGTDGRLEQYTQFNAPSVSGYTVFQQELAKRQIILDDGSDDQNPDPIAIGRGGNPLSAANTLRGGDTTTGLAGILDDRFGDYRIQATAPVNFLPTNPRETIPPAVGGTLKVASFNVLNYFNGDGVGGGFPTARGAETAIEFQRQRDKTIAAVLGLNADVVGLIELENDGYGATSAIQNLVNGLNAVAGAGTYAFITPPATALISGDRLGGDQIQVGFIYKLGKVTPIGAAATVPDGFGQGAFNNNNRKPLAQTFQQNDNGAAFTAVINHLKSKGSSSGNPGDADAGDGQGLSNGTRTRAAQDLATWLATNPTGTADPDYLILGDLNAYAKEDPLTTLAAAGYGNLLPDTTYSYVFDGQWGSLDHALGNSSIASQVTGAAKWHINADEPSVLDYNTNFKSAGQVASLYAPNAFRSSDHDPVVVGLNLTKPNTAPIAVNDLATAIEGQSVTLNVLANDTDADADALTITTVTAPGLGGVVNNGNGTITYTAPLDFVGGDRFTYTISDGKGGTSTATVDLTITPLNLIGTPNADSLTGTNSNNTINGLAGNDTILGQRGSDLLIGGGGQDTFVIRRGDGNDIISDFGGVGKGVNPAAAVIAEVDTLKFEGAGLTAQNLILTQVGSDLVIGFAGIADTQVTLQNFVLENLENLRKSTGAKVDLGNLLFDGQTTIQDSFDVFDANSAQGQIWNRNSVTFLNEGNNNVNGLNNSNDVINGQGGSDRIDGGSGDDLIRGGAGNDILIGGKGLDTLSGGTGRDIFVLERNADADTITDFTQGEDLLALSNGLKVSNLLIEQGTGSNLTDTFIYYQQGNTKQLLAILEDVQSKDIDADDFIPNF